MKLLPKNICLAVIAALTFGSVARADQTITYPEKNPIFSISFPDGWKVEPGEDSVSASSADDLVNMELMALDAEELAGAVEAAKEALTEELKGLKWEGEPEKGELNGMNVTFVNGQVAIEEVKMAVNCAIFEPKGAKTFFMLFNVIPLEALQQHGDDVSKVLNSIKGK